MTKPTINEILLEKEKNAKHEIYLRQPRDGHWYEYSWGKVMQQARRVAAFLQAEGLKKGDRVSIFSKNCAEWFIADFGISLAGMINVPLFGNQPEDTIHYILDHADVKLVFVGKLDNHLTARANIPSGMKTVSFDYHDDMETDKKWLDVLQTEPLEEVFLPTPDDLFTFIYTSGTSAKPKGVVYTHGTIANYLELFPRDFRRHTDLEHQHFISYLPLAHVYERTAVELGSVTVSCDVSFVESLDKFAENLQEVRPTLFTAVPRIWGVFQQKIEAKLPPAKLNFLLKIPFISGLIKKKITKQLGLDRCVNCASGASHLPESIIEFFEKLDILIQEGYGQSENLAYATLAHRDKRKHGYVGTPRLGVEIKMGDKNELLTRSDCQMKEYYQDKQQTKETLTEDGWLHTGDIAEIDNEQNVKILGRLSENFKNQKGEFIAPAPIEKRFSSNGHVENLCLIGRELPNNVMVVVLSENARKKDREKVEDSLKQTLRRINEKLASYEKISHVVIIKDEWTPENGILTPTLKVKRREVEERFRDDIKKASDQNSPVYWQD